MNKGSIERPPKIFMLKTFFLHPKDGLKRDLIQKLFAESLLESPMVKIDFSYFYKIPVVSYCE